MAACTNCGADNPPAARQCGTCGIPLPSEPPELGEVRKVVTVVFTDVIGSTEIGERLDPETVRRVMSLYFEAMREELERHGGSVEKFIGDAVMAVFGVPHVHEDDALRAVRAASDMRGRLAELNEELERQWGVHIEARTGVNTGEVVTGDPAAGGSLVVGDAVNVAARLEQGAAPGEILLGGSTFRLVRDAATAEPLEPLHLRGRGEPVAAFRLLGIDPIAPGTARGRRSAMVGRQGERILLQQAFERTARDRTCNLFTILGAAGVGKSRLASEVMTACEQRGTVLSGRCLPYGEGITFWPLVEVVRQAASLSDADAPPEARAKIAAAVKGTDDADLVASRVAQVIGLAEGTGDTEETAWAVRRLFQALAEPRPLVVMFDDLHWAEPTLLDLIDHVADSSRQSPILLLCLARPEFLDHRPTWGGGKHNATTIMLEPLTDEESSVLITNLLGRAELVDEVRRRIAEAAEGNPLFVEELLSMLIDQGLLRHADGRWEITGDLSALAVPPTITALLSARVDRLAPGERGLIERAAIEGKVFHRGAVEALTPEKYRPQLDAHVASLIHKELILPARTNFAGEQAYQFRHILIHEVVYRGLPKENRAELHARFAAWLQQTSGAWLPEYEEILGYHLEQAFRSRQELGPVDRSARRLAALAAEHLVRAAGRAMDRGDMPAAAKLLERAVTLMEPGDPARLPPLLDLGEACIEVGDFARAGEVFDDVLAAAEDAGDPRSEWLAKLGRLEIRINTDPGGITEDAQGEAEQAVRFFEERSDDAGLAKAWHVLALVWWNDARAGDTEHALEQAVRHARLAGDRRAEIDDLALLTMPASWGPLPVPVGIERTEQIVERAGQHRKVEAFSLITRGTLEARRGEIDTGRRLVARGRQILADLGLRVMAAATSHAGGQVEMLADDPVAAERELREGYEALHRLGEKAYLSTSAGYLAEALYAQGRLDDAERYARTSEQAADPRDLASQILWRAARARILARRGDLDEAERLAADALTLADGTDLLDARGDVHMAMADVHQLAGRPGKAADEVRRALELYDSKGNVVMSARARRRIETLTG